MIHSRFARALMISAALAASLAACQREGDKVDKVKVSAEATASGPLTYVSKTPFANVSLTLPEAIKTQPGLYKPLYDKEVEDLMSFAEGSQADRTEAGTDASMPPYEKSITYSGVVQTGRLFSTARTDFDFSGGAHPNTVSTALLWDKTTQKRISSSDLFTKDANLAAVETALCDAVKAAKTKRPGSISLAAKDNTWGCPKLKDTPFILAPGSTEGKAGGLTFLIGSYAVGPYSEGAYYLTLPTTRFQTLLNPTYAAEFAGQPSKPGDITLDLLPK